VGAGTVICPLHAWKFDLKSGELLSGDCKLKTYAVALDSASQIVLTWPVPTLKETTV
jgi:nitrite reductase (NADH) small subunit